MVGEQPQMDKERTEWLSKEGYRVIRFTNEDVFNRLDKVLDKIAEELEKQFGIKLDKRNIKVDSPIRSVGLIDVPVKIYQDITGVINLRVKEG